MEKIVKNEINHTNTSIEELKTVRETLLSRRDEIMSEVEELRFKSKYGSSQEEKDEAKKMLPEAYTRAFKNSDLGELESKINENYRSIVFRTRKDLTENYLVTNSVIQDLYNVLLELPENDPRIKEIESKIEEIEVLLSEDLDKLHEEGVHTDEANSGRWTK